MQACLEAQGLEWSWPGADAPVFSDVELSLPEGFSGLVGPNGCGKSLLLSLLSGNRPLQKGRVQRHGSLGWLCQDAAERREGNLAQALGFGPQWESWQRLQWGTAVPEDLARLEDCWNLPERLTEAMGKVGLEIDPGRNLASLSGGERVRIGLAALWLERPRILLLDEPTNHLDRPSRSLLRQFLSQWDGAVLAASHDRMLLKDCDRIYELSGRLRAWGGGWQAFREGRDHEQEVLQQRQDDARKTLKDVQKRRQEAMERQAKRQMQGKRQAQSGGMPKIVAGMLQRNGEATASRLRGIHDLRLEKAQEQVAASSLRRSHGLFLDLTLPSSSKGVVSLEDFTPAPNGAPLWRKPLDLELHAPTRIGLVGRNGSGKSLLLRSLAGEPLPTLGTMRTQGRVQLLDQELRFLGTLGSAREALTRFSPPELPASEVNTRLGRLRLRGIHADVPISGLSGGERLRLTLACLLSGAALPDVLLLDEPTNHLDLESVATLVEALSGWHGLLIVASHDESLLDDLEARERIDLDERN
jgi:ATPase subunit of ABC transporter with duplicated ATPase domains